jgi:magnesium chelatase subunit I
VTAPTIATLADLRESGHVHRGVKAEIRENLIERLAAGEASLPGIVGFDDTVVPEVERALLAGHDMVLLGERG